MPTAKPEHKNKPGRKRIPDPTNQDQDAPSKVRRRRNERVTNPPPPTKGKRTITKGRIIAPGKPRSKVNARDAITGGKKNGHPIGWVNPNPTTPETRRRKGEICGAKRTGKSSSGPGICCMPAGWGTEHLGMGACKLHGGNQPAHNAAAVKRTLREEMELLDDWTPVLGKPIEIDPHSAVLGEIHRTAGHISWLHNKIVELGIDPDTPEGEMLKSIGENRTLHQWTNLGIKPSVWIEMYQSERVHLIQVCKAAVTMGVAERQITLAEDQGKLIAMVLLAFIRDKELGLTPQQRAIAPEIARRHLTAIPVTGREAQPATKP